eukprot:422371-Pyramimonas_sp.AAC.1
MFRTGCAARDVHSGNIEMPPDLMVSFSPKVEGRAAGRGMHEVEGEGILDSKSRMRPLVLHSMQCSAR